MIVFGTGCLGNLYRVIPMEAKVAIAGCVGGTQMTCGITDAEIKTFRDIMLEPKR